MTKKIVKANPKPKAAKKIIKKAPPPVVVPPVVMMPPTTVVVPSAATAASNKTEAQKIWEEIKDLSIQMFGLPEQFVFQHCTPVSVDPTKLFVTVRSTAVLPSLEVAIAPHFVVELADKFVIVSRTPQPLTVQKK